MTIEIQIGDAYPRRWSRRQPGGLFLPVTASGGPVRAIELSMEGDGSGPFRIEFPGRRDGRWFRGAAWKPEITGEWWPLVKAFETLEAESPIYARRGPHRVTVTEDQVFLPADAAGPAPFQIRAAFYYPWFVGPTGWGTIGTRWSPTLGRYDLLDLSVIDAHIRALEYGRFDAAIASWWGPRTPTDGRVPALLERSEGHALRWALYYEMEGHTHPAVEQLRDDLAYIRTMYAAHPNYLRIGGRFVVFVYSADDGASCDVAARWKQANDMGDAYIVLKQVGNYADCPNQPDGWHQYGPANDVQTTWDAAGRLHAYNIAPGFWHGQEGAPRLVRDLARWQQNIRDMVNSGARWQLVTSFNEWGEGTSVESAAEWASASGYGAYLDALHAADITKK